LGPLGTGYVKTLKYLIFVWIFTGMNEQNFPRTFHEYIPETDKHYSDTDTLFDMSLLNLRHIACVVDFNEESRMALSFAGTMARSSSAELYAIHIIERLAAFGNNMLSALPTYQTTLFDYASDESFQKSFRDMMKQSLPQDISLIPLIVYGSRTQNILDILRVFQVDLCIIGIRNHGAWWEHLFAPPVTKQIINRAPCPVLAINSYSLHGE
jgi:nucleotide-binding universal stress UspA family protein